MLTSRFSAAALTLSVAAWRLLPLSPPPGLSALVVLMWALLLMLRSGLPGMKLGRTTSVTLWVSPLASVPMLQLKVAAAGVIWLPAEIEQAEPALDETTDTTVSPVSPAPKLKASSTATPSAADGPLLRKDST